MSTQHTKEEATRALQVLRGFIGKSQLNAIGNACRGEEKQFFFDMLVELAERVSTMPKTYEQDDKGDEAIAYLHYFAGGQANWWIMENTPEMFQCQAFGLADLFNDGGELGYISIGEILSVGGELDLYFTPCTLGDLGSRHDEPARKTNGKLQEGYYALSPDGFPSSKLPTFYATPSEAIRAFVERYREQGYYATSGGVMIPVDDLFHYVETRKGRKGDQA